MFAKSCEQESVCTEFQYGEGHLVHNVRWKVRISSRLEFTFVDRARGKRFKNRRFYSQGGGLARKYKCSLVNHIIACVRFRNFVVIGIYPCNRSALGQSTDSAGKSLIYFRGDRSIDELYGWKYNRVRILENCSKMNWKVTLLQMINIDRVSK